MGVSKYLWMMRQSLGFLLVFAFVLPASALYLQLESGESVLVFMSLVGVCGGVITFAGITFDLQLFSLSAGTSFLLWTTGLVFTGINICILILVYLHSAQKIAASKALTYTALLVMFSFFFGRLLLIPLPFVGAAAVIRVLTASRKKEVLPALQGPEIGGQDIGQESVVFKKPIEASWIRKVPRLFIHGTVYSVLSIPYGMLWSILSGAALSTGNLLGSTATLVVIALSFGSLFIGFGLMNAWITERVWKIYSEYGIGTLLLSGILLFVASEAMVSPLSTIVYMFLENSIVAVVIVFLFRYSIVSLVLGLVGFAIGSVFAPKEKTDSILLGVERIIRDSPVSNDFEDESDEPHSGIQ
jgi:hypothetical protein